MYIYMYIYVYVCMYIYIYSKVYRELVYVRVLTPEKVYNYGFIFIDCTPHTIHLLITYLQIICQQRKWTNNNKSFHYLVYYAC